MNDISYIPALISDPGRISILISDTNEIFRAGLRSILKSNFNKISISSVKNEDEILLLIKTIKFHFFFLDLDSLKLHSEKIIREIRIHNPASKIIFLSSFFEHTTFQQMKSAAANGILSKSSSEKEILLALSTIKSGNVFICERFKNNILKRILIYEKSYVLDKINREVLFLISHQLTVKQISECLMLTEKAIEYHRTLLYKITGKKNLAGLAVYSVHQNIYSDLHLCEKFKDLIL